MLGWWWRGKDEIRRKLTGAFAVVFRDSRLTITDVNVRLLDAHYAIAHVRWTMQGGKAPPGAAQPQLQALRKDHGQWLVASIQNTNSVPETEFPHPPS